ncbi:PREDICTED: protein C3orf33 homolog [Nanorana parkeri]|uniref:protein C3orf33 homolog n=1 Tax=Nanorana parkeri TaxID=125878 RepID=UPI0008549817|nr:PREDICTED: protein C3orf33 homolog [Nanorana parkeri]
MAPSDPADNLISKVSQLADSHIYFVRNISIGLAVAGVVLCARSIKLVTKFTNAKHIPDNFIKRSVKLRGKVISVKEHTIEIEHIPIRVPILTSLLKKWHGHGILLVRLAGVELTPSGQHWLLTNLQPSQRLWFQLLNREDSMLDCFIFINRGGFFNECLNVVLLKEGLGRAAHISSKHAEPGHHWTFYKRLLQAEVRAQRARKGIWEQESQLDVLKNKIFTHSIFQKTKQLLNSLVTYWKQFRS